MVLEKQEPKLANAIGWSFNETRGLARWKDARNADGAR